ncbi:Uu.00g108130.m01.CDS01 [Anthostomella pinea]|uniref:Uu.00g108130.m01.CDS01 n=1 Tax=Anthostomella pinea TaxID=933095 RepID=A0AAI8YG26_9PEZI|nr:Uu.00g108130.m01.CDS01 [Anthostomella pinea]
MDDFHESMNMLDLPVPNTAEDAALSLFFALPSPEDQNEMSDEESVFGRMLHAIELFHESFGQSKTSTDEDLDYLHRVADEALERNTSGKICANCGRPGAQKACTGCLVSIAGRAVIATEYCGQHCQTLRSKRHMTSCNDVRRLGRASSMFHELFTHYTRISFSQQVVGVTERGGVLVADYASGNPLVYQGKHILHRFPENFAQSESVAEAVAEAVVEAVMMCFSCCEVVDTAGTILEEFFDSPGRTLESVFCEVKNVQRPVAMRTKRSSGEEYTFNTFMQHNLVRITLESGLQFALYFSCAQFGWHEYLSPWDEYERHRIHHIAYVSPFATEGLSAMLTQVRISDGDPATECQSAKDIVVLGLHQHLQTTTARFGGLGGFLGLEEGFEEARTTLLAEARTFMDAKSRPLEQLPVYKLYFDKDFNIAVTNDAETHNLLKKLWFPKEEFDQTSDNPPRLRRI